MLGHNAREFKQHQFISLEDLVPDDNFYRPVERSLKQTYGQSAGAGQETMRQRRGMESVQ